MADNEHLKRVYDEFTTVWRFYRKYADVKDDDKYWDEVIGESHQIAEEYGGAGFVIDLLLAVVTELERRAKELRDKDAQAAGG